jgi:PKD domain
MAIGNYQKIKHSGLWQVLLAIMLGLAGIGLFLAPLSWAALTPTPVTVDSLVRVSFEELEYNRRTNTYDGTATLTNRSTQTISAPIRLVINNIKPSTVTLANATGLLLDGSPYVDVPVNKNGLSPGQKVKNIPLKFNDPKRVKFTFSNNVLGVIPHVNHPPVANAGPDQSAIVGSTVTLDGSGSTDIDGDPLTYRWRIASQPVANAAVIDNASAIKPNVIIHQKGTYQIELIVNDGIVDSALAITTITTTNSKPVAMAGPDQTVFVKQTAFLDGIASYDR